MIEFDNVNLSYNGNGIIHNLCFKINIGDKVVFSGKSGSGKTSIFDLCLGFIRPDSGKIIFEGIPIDEQNIWDIRKKVAYIDQDVSLGTGMVKGFFDFVSNLKSNAHLDFNLDQIKELIDYFELEGDILNKNIEELSGGERQRLAIIISILLGRDIFFLDEVTSALDKHLKHKVVDYFVLKKDLTCLISAHDSIWLNNSGLSVFDLEEGKWRQ